MTETHIQPMTLPLSRLRQMEIIDVSEGKRLGFISDIEFDEGLNRVEGLIIPPQGGVFSFFKKKDEMHIKWYQIKVIGLDIILVDLSKKFESSV